MIRRDILPLDICASFLPEAFSTVLSAPTFIHNLKTQKPLLLKRLLRLFNSDNVPL
ncbi:MAG: hypothetical protein Q7T94_01115 [Rugosibacter sp.]|nr:K699 [uncultured bacterium]MDO9271604.1 hypothetical protein [Rugosibacter sp.]